MTKKKDTPPDPVHGFESLLAAKPADLSARDRITRTALVLFNRQGVHTTGIDQIIAESGVAKMTFYNHFPTKNKLVAEYLRLWHGRWFAIAQEFTQDPKKSPLERALGVFDGLEAWFENPDFCGCPFIRGLADFSDDREDPEINEIVAGHFSRTNLAIEEMLKSFRPGDYKDLARTITTMVLGTIVVAQSAGNPKVARQMKESARALLTRK